MTPEISQTLDRGLTLLSLLADAPEGRTVAELATELGVGRTVVYRLVGTLESHDLARRDSSGRVTLGLGALRLAGAVAPQVRAVTSRILRQLADRLGATAHLTVADGDEGSVLVAVEPTWTQVHVAYRVGARHSLQRGAAGRAILGGRSGDASAVETSGELQEGATGVAAPVLGVPGFEASVGVVALQPLNLVDVGPLVSAAARQVAEQLLR